MRTILEYCVLAHEGEPFPGGKPHVFKQLERWLG